MLVSKEEYNAFKKTYLPNISYMNYIQYTSQINQIIHWTQFSICYLPLMGQQLRVCRLLMTCFHCFLFPSMSAVFLSVQFLTWPSWSDSALRFSSPILYYFLSPTRIRFQINIYCRIMNWHRDISHGKNSQEIFLNLSFHSYKIVFKVRISYSLQT